MKICFNETKDAWDNFVQKSLQGSVFVTTSFLSSFKINYKLVTLKEGDKILCGAPIFFEEGKPSIRVMPYSQYQGLLHTDNSLLATHSKYQKELENSEFFLREVIEKFGQVAFSCSPNLEDLRAFSWYNYGEKKRFNIELRYSSILDLQKFANFDEYLCSVRKCRRQEYNKTILNGLKVEQIDDVNILDELHALTFDRNEEDGKLLKPIAAAALKNGYGRLACVRYKGKPIAANLFIFDQKSGYYLFGANHPDYRKLNAGTLLLFDAVRDCIERKLREVDFVGVNSPNRGDYKLSFNGKLKPFFITTFKG